jgi:plasmid stability protein
MAEGRIAQGLEAKLCCGCWLGVWVAGQSIVLGALFMRIAELKNTSPKLLSMITTQPARDNIAIGSRLECKMANLLVRGLDDSLVQTLREQAAAHGRSVEAEHREILAQALRRPRKRSFAQVLMDMPEVGRDDDFARLDDAGGAAGVFA